jgi:outer membrane immunogenic protein
MYVFRLATVALIALATVVRAGAADLPVSPPPAPPAYAPAVVPAFSWTGFYAGANVGAAWGHDEVTWTSDPGGFGPNFAAALNTAGTTAIQPVGVTAGGQFGFNVQTGIAVWGLEADLNYAGISGSSLSPVLGAAPGNTASSTFKSQWFATARARFGVTATPRFLLYLTGGLAVAEVKTSDLAVFADGSSNAAANSSTKLGWTGGVGTEWAFDPNWSAKFEYLFVDLGSMSATSQNTLFPAAVIDHSHAVTESVVRAGINFQFH